MLNKSLSLFLFAIMVTLVSCETRFESDDVNLSVEEEILHSVSLEQAIDVANNYVLENDIIIPTRGRALAIEKAYTIKDRGTTPIVHAINYKDGGFALISADNRLTPVLAYSDKGEFAYSEETAPLGLRAWMESVRNMIKEATVKEQEPAPGIAAVWSLFSSDPIDYLTRSQIPDEWPYPEADTIVGPLITDSWHQYSPYNDYLTPALHFNGYTYVGPYTPLVGCLQLSVARVMRYNEYPTSFSWNNMPDDEPQTTTTKYYLKNVHDNVKSYAQDNGFYVGYYYSPQSVSVGENFPIDEFMADQYGYIAAEEFPYTRFYYEDIRRDIISYQLPCIISGYSSDDEYTRMGHVWICDGYHYNFFYTDIPGQDPEGIKTTHLHYCWGMTNCSSDGWYYSTDYTLYNLNYIYNMKLTRHISPIDYWEFE